MEGEKLEEIMLGFMEGAYDILVCTKIVENGLDVPNANTIIVNDAHHYGLSELHQLRGRVGRSNKKPSATCWHRLRICSRPRPNAACGPSKSFPT